MADVLEVIIIASQWPMISNEKSIVIKDFQQFNSGQTYPSFNVNVIASEIKVS